MVFSFFRSARPQAGASSTPEARSRSLAERAWTVHRRVDEAYEELGPFATVMARRILDGVAAVLKQAGSEDRLDIRATVTLERILEDYLPTTLRTYARARHDPSSVPQVERQLVHLATAVEEILVAVRDNNVQDLQVQGDFLDTKYNGSDLRL